MAKFAEAIDEMHRNLVHHEDVPLDRIMASDQLVYELEELNVHDVRRAPPPLMAAVAEQAVDWMDLPTEMPDDPIKLLELVFELQALLFLARRPPLVPGESGDEPERRDEDVPALAEVAR